MILVYQHGLVQALQLYMLIGTNSNTQSLTVCRVYSEYVGNALLHSPPHVHTAGTGCRRHKQRESSLSHSMLTIINQANGAHGLWLPDYSNMWSRVGLC